MKKKKEYKKEYKKKFKQMFNDPIKQIDELIKQANKLQPK